MGTFLGNLQVLGAEEAEISAVFPKASLGRWSERFVTVMEASFAFGSVDRFAKKLSKQLPQAAVLGVGLIDSDALELTVYAGGKRITVHRGEYEDDPGKKGDPRKFCAALGLPEEDIFRLKAVWEKGDAEEQLELTAALLGAPLNCRVDWPPEESVVRNTALVDEWIAQRPDPPKVKNQTRVVVLQERPVTNIGELMRIQYPNRPPYFSDDMLYPLSSPFFSNDMPYPIGDGRVLTLRLEQVVHARQIVEILKDSAGLLICPFPFELDGSRRSFDKIWSMPDGGILVWYWGLSDPSRDLVRYASDGSILWRRRFGTEYPEVYCNMFWDDLVWFQGENEFFSVDLDGNEYSHIARDPRATDVPDSNLITKFELYEDQRIKGELWLIGDTLDRETCCSTYSLHRFDRRGNLLQEAPLPARLHGALDHLLLFPNRVLLCGYNTGVWLMDRKDLSVLASIEDHREYHHATLDGAGRIWLSVGGSILEAYDQNLTLLSRHRLKGRPEEPRLDDTGRLCVRTYDKKTNLLRVYRLE